MSPPQDVLAFADRFMETLNTGDPAAVSRFYAPDATIWHNFDNVDQTLPENLKMLEWMNRKAPQRRYRVLRREVIPGGWFQQHVLEAKLANDREMRLYACCVITVQDGVIKRVEEYVDPAQAAVLREAKTA